MEHCAVKATTPAKYRNRIGLTVTCLAFLILQEVLSSIASYSVLIKGLGVQQASATGVQVLQQLICSSSTTVQEGAMQLLHAMSSAGLAGKAQRQKQ